MSRADTVLRNGRFFSSGCLSDGGVAIRDGRIVSLGGNAYLPDGAEEIDLNGLTLLPGGVDTHVHVRDPGRRDRGTFASETLAAAAGGITTIFEMPISSPPQYSAEIVRDRVRCASAQSVVDFAFYGAAGNRLDQIPSLADADIVAFKTFLFKPPRGREEEFIGTCMEDDGNLLEGLAAIARTGKICAVHAENDSIIQMLTKRLRADGAVDFLSHGASRPPVSEVAAVEKVILYARSTGARISVCHVSTPEAMERIRSAKREGYPVFAETCPQYLFCDEESVAPLGPFAKFNPPIRNRETKERLWDFVRDGTVDFIGSDHGPFPISEKEPGVQDIFTAPAGSVGFEERLPLLITAVREGMLSLERMVELHSLNAARIFGIHPKKGALAIGADADLVALDPDASFQVERSCMKTAGREIARLYEGRRLFGRAEMTLVRGRIVYSRRSEPVPRFGWGKNVFS